ncbi:MAG: metallophosphoesterase family protein [Candidatus Falkowbacteria bacterium]
MKIAIISDIHDNLSNLKLFFNWTKKESIEKIICCGDVTNSETIDFLSKNFTGEIILVRGNMEVYDEDILSGYLSINCLGRYGVSELNGISVGVCHEPDFIPRVMEKNSAVKMVFYGHTHKPWLETKGETTFVNPGTLGGVFQKASFAFWNTETGKLELKLLELIN